MKRKLHYRTDYTSMYPGVEISSEVLGVLKKSDRCLEYQERDLKRERVHKTTDGAKKVLPAREDSLDRLLAADWDFAADIQTPEQTACEEADKEELWRCIALLEKDEQVLIQALYMDGSKEHEIAKTLGISQQAISKRRMKIVKKLKNLINI